MQPDPTSNIQTPKSRICLIIPVGIDRPSGIRYFQIARALVRQGYRVRILALHPDLPNCTRRRYVEDEVEIWYVGQMHVRKGPGGVERFGPLRLLSVLLRSTLGLVWGILCSPADLYHLGKPQPVNGLAALLGLCLLRRSFYLDCDDDETTGNRFSAGWQRAVFAFWQWLMPRLATGVTVNTPFLRERMERAGIAPVVYVPNGVDLARFRPLAAERLAALRWSLGLEQRRIIVYLGSIALQNHPVDLLLDAFVRIATVMPDTALLIVGDGEDLPLLQQRAFDTGLAARVRFVGRVPQAAAPAYLALADISADPVYDNPVARARSPLKLFESLALGVPVVTGDVGDRRALLDGGAAGVLVAPGNAAALAGGLREVLDNPQRRHAMAQAGLRHIQRYGWDTLAATWVRVYHRPNTTSRSCGSL